MKWLNNGLVIHLKRPRPCKVNLRVEVVQEFQRKLTFFPQLSEPASLGTRKIKGQKVLPTALKRQSRHFPFELTGCELNWQGWGSKGSKLQNIVVAKLEGKITQSKLGPLSCEAKANTVKT